MIRVKGAKPEFEISVGAKYSFKKKYYYGIEDYVEIDLPRSKIELAPEELNLPMSKLVRF